jgi:PPK2 family polyphosphate:nucleotide phosphotransferase
VTAESTEQIAGALAVSDGFSLANSNPAATSGFAGDKQQAAEVMTANAAELAELQERLFANGSRGAGPSLLLIVQGMDTAGKGGIMRHVVGQVDPQGVRIKAFKAPTQEELAHPFLWRIYKELPAPGQLAVFDRSHYEDVLIARVNELVEEEVWSGRYEQINAFEKEVDASGTRIVKVMLHISSDEQRRRLERRLDNPDKHWKYDPVDVTERMHWDAYMTAYQAMLDRTNTAWAPWHVVPADRKWYARLAVNQLLLERLRAMNLEWPKADFDVAAERVRLDAS